MYIFLFFRARRRGIWLFSNIHTCLAANWGRKWSVFGFWKKSKISQNVLQKSMTEKNDFLILGRVKSFVGPRTSFLTPDFLSGAFRKGCNFMIACDHKLILSDHLHPKVWVKYQLRFSITPPSKIVCYFRQKSRSLCRWTALSLSTICGQRSPRSCSLNSSWGQVQGWGQQVQCHRDCQVYNLIRRKSLDLLTWVE